MRNACKYLSTAQAFALIIHLHTVPYELTVNYINFYSLMKYHRIVTLNVMNLGVLFLNTTLSHAANYTTTCTNITNENYNNNCSHEQYTVNSALCNEMVNVFKGLHFPLKTQGRT